ncbi:hypothetical protein CD113_03290 [Staphylococcus simiae]|uniref:Uncharacterized protein n=2 Tax=Staphylococcus simiae TaxID=308354 RepID=G5JFV5_9STAP|nr:hypothetical protein [Staphylococcus simiae]EHJ08903.1 hypothetical protein SS7213T_01596 [Staphylococcus simiae CCM 7213 = CCUG 51256]PNZ13978.1 hypothetical protein CD113_03290 [Staphylococcus simiae]
MNVLIEDIKKSQWCMVTMVISSILFIFLKIMANEFVKQFGNDVNIRNLGKDGYLSGTLLILLIALITAVFSILTAYLGFRSLRYDFNITSLICIALSITLLMLTFFISEIPFLKTAILVLIIGFVIIAIVNNN